jgi:Arc/MetJ-type ribon-helix-helix transcriptional regulator
MTMISFRVDDADVAEIERWARRLHIDRSELLRDALRRHLAELAADEEVRAYAENPVTEEEMALAQVAEWGLAEDWADWADAAR